MDLEYAKVLEPGSEHIGDVSGNVEYVIKLPTARSKIYHIVGSFFGVLGGPT